MQITGNITNIVPTDGYKSGQGKWIYTFDMTIDTNAGPVLGDIGSTAQQYPLGVGQSIIVDVTSNEHGNKFKRFNPRQDGGQQQNQGGQGQRSAPPAQGRDYDKENKGKCFCNYVSAMLGAGVAPQEIIKTHTGDLWTLAGMSLDPPAAGGTGFFTPEEQAAHDAADGVGDY